MARRSAGKKWYGPLQGYLQQKLKPLPAPHLAALASRLGHTSPVSTKEQALMAIQEQLAARIRGVRGDPARLLSERRPRFVRKFCGAVPCGRPGCRACVGKMADVSVQPSGVPERSGLVAPKELATVENVEVFGVGNHRGKEYTPDDLDTIVANFQRLSDPALPPDRRILRPTIVVGHEEAGEQPLTNTGWPAAGLVTKLWRSGDKLYANFGDVVPLIAKLIGQRSYRATSSEIYDDFDYQGNRYGMALRRIALLGGELPQIKDLQDIPLATFADAPGTKILRTFHEIRPMPTAAATPARVFQGANGKWYWASARVRRFAECVRKACESNPNFGGRPTPAPPPAAPPARQTLPERIQLFARQNFQPAHADRVAQDLIDVAAGNREGNAFEKRAVARALGGKAAGGYLVKAKAPAAPKAPKPAAKQPDAAAAVKKIAALYGKATHPNLTQEKIDRAVATLAPLKKVGLEGIVQGMGFRRTSRLSKQQLLRLIQNRISSRRSSYRYASSLPPL